MITVTHADDEVGAGEQQDLPGFDDVVGGGHRFVLDIGHCAQHQEQQVVVALELRALMGVYRVLDHQLVQIERARHARHLMFVRLVESEPDEALAASTNLREGGGVGVPAGESRAVDVDRAVDHRTFGGDVDRRYVGCRAAFRTRQGGVRQRVPFRVEVPSARAHGVLSA